jgi:hypothetical protein
LPLRASLTPRARRIVEARARGQHDAGALNAALARSAGGVVGTGGAPGAALALGAGQAKRARRDLRALELRHAEAQDAECLCAAEGVV